MDTDQLISVRKLRHYEVNIDDRYPVDDIYPAKDSKQLGNEKPFPSCFGEYIFNS